MEENKLSTYKPEGSEQQCTMCEKRAFVSFRMIRNPARYPHGPTIFGSLCMEHARSLYGMLEDWLFGNE